MSSSPSKPVSGLIRCKGITKSSGEQCRHTQHNSQYCWTHKDQADPPSEHQAAELTLLGLFHLAISASTKALLSCRLEILLPLGFLAIRWLIGPNSQIDFSVPKYRGPVRVCANPEPSLDIFSEQLSSTGRSGFPGWWTPSTQKQIDPVFEPASLVDHAVNATIPAAGAGAQNLRIRQTKGLAMWQKCSKEKISANFDLQCPFDAFNQLFFGGHLARVKFGWKELTSFPTTPAGKKEALKIRYGETYDKPSSQSDARPVNITILSRESSFAHPWRSQRTRNPTP